jgi:ankyrin repeat protein
MQEPDTSAAGKRPIDAFDRQGFTPLMNAVRNPHADADTVRALLTAGADPHLSSCDNSGLPRSVIRLALAAGDPDKVQALLDAGVDLRYRADSNYDALIDAVHGRDVLRDDRLLSLLRLLVTHGVPIDGVSTYGESGLRVLSRLGRFDAVQLLLEAGAPAAHLDWTPLHAAAAWGSVAETTALLQQGATLTAQDSWARTPWHVALQAGDVQKAMLLLAHGADPNARGRCGKPSLHFAIETHQLPMLRWLLALPLDVEQSDDFGTTPLIAAAECDNAEATRLLIAHHADLERQCHGRTALGHASSRDVVTSLLDAGANAAELTNEGRRVLIGLPPDPDPGALDGVTREQFIDARSPRFGTANSEEVVAPFWQAMIRSGVSGYEATQAFDGPSSIDSGAVWCAQRFGQSITRLPDGRTVLIGGEHEDSYDADFCIYNDVFVHDPQTGLRVFCYPKEDFAPTDFHSATLVGRSIVIVGGLGYWGSRRHGTTPVVRLDLEAMRMQAVATVGDGPGWIYKHRATLTPNGEIRVWKGTVADSDAAAGASAGAETHLDNLHAFVLDLTSGRWRREAV